MILELSSSLKEWITVKELPGKGRILKFAPQVNAATVTKLLTEKYANQQQ